MPSQAHGRFHWNELMTWNVEKAKAFYADTLGWHFESVPLAEGGAYTECTAGNEPVCGIMEMTPGTGFDGLPDSWFAYITVDDVDACVAKVEDAGGEVVHGPFDIPEFGRVVIVNDAVGAQIGWITPERKG